MLLFLFLFLFSTFYYLETWMRGNSCGTAAERKISLTPLTNEGIGHFRFSLKILIDYVGYTVDVCILWHVCAILQDEAVRKSDESRLTVTLLGNLKRSIFQCV